MPTPMQVWRTLIFQSRIMFISSVKTWCTLHDQHTAAHDAVVATGIPLQTIWSDIDYMEGWRDFTWAHDRYPLEKFQVCTQTLLWLCTAVFLSHPKSETYVGTLQALVAKVHARGQHWVPIIDPGIMVNPQVKSASHVLVCLSIMWRSRACN